MRIKKEPSNVWAEYQRGINYNQSIGLYETVKQNNNFYNDKQWEGVNAPDLDKPVFNFLKPVVSYYVAMLISDDVAVNVELGNETETGAWRPQAGGLYGADKRLSVGELPVPYGAGASMMAERDVVPKVIAQEVDNIIEQTNLKYKNRRAIRNCAVDGDACMYLWFDPDAETGFAHTGTIRADVLDNTNVLFGNPTEENVQEQPYVLLAYRRLTEDVRDEAEANGFPRESVTPDNEDYYTNTEYDGDNDYTTVILKMWKEKGSVRTLKCTRDAPVKEETDTEYKLYPLAWMSWESVKNSYHGVSPITGKIPNQIFVNKIYAMAQRQVQDSAFPKVIYDKNKIARWDPSPGKAVGVVGDPTTALFAGFRPPEMSADPVNMAEVTVQQTRNMMGASDAALGNVKPDNTSAIIAVQKAAGMPLDIQKMDFYNFVEACVRIFLEIMRVNYGVRYVTLKDPDGNDIRGEFDFSLLGDYALSLKIDIGAGSYWSELMQVQTLDNLMSNQIIPDAVTYLEAIPEGYIKNKNRIIERIKEQQQIQEMMQSQAAMPPQIEGQEKPILPGIEEQDGPETQGGGLTADEVNGIISELVQMEDDEAVETVNAMEISGEDKAGIIEALAVAKGEGNAG